MAVVWFLTRAAVKISLFQDNYLSYSIPHRENVGEKQYQSFAVSRNLQKAKNRFIEANIYKNISISDTTPNSVSTSTGLRVSNMISSSHNVTNVTFSFETYLNAKTR